MIFILPSSTGSSVTRMQLFRLKRTRTGKDITILCVNDIPLVQWFRQKANKWKNSLGIIPAKQDEWLKIQDILKNTPKANKNIIR